MAAFENEIGDECHPSVAERRPSLIVGLDPAQVWIVGERADPQVDDRLEISTERMPKPESRAAQSVAAMTVSQQAKA